MQKNQLEATGIFMAALAVNQQQPEIALDITKDETMCSAIRHIHLLAYLQMSKFHEILQMFKQIIENFTPDKKTELTISIEVVGFWISFEYFIVCIYDDKPPIFQMMLIEKTIQHNGLIDQKQNFLKIREQIKSLDLISSTVN